MAGTVNCCNCNTALDIESDDATGICPKCKKARHVYVRIYWEGKHQKIKEDSTTKARLEFFSGRSLLKEIRNEVDKARKTKRHFDLMPYLGQEQNPNAAARRLEEWLAHLEELVEQKKFGRGTWKGYTYTVNLHFVPSFGEKDLNQLEYTDLERLFTFLPCTIESAKTYRGTLRAFLKWCWKMGYIKQLPPFPTISGSDKKPKYVLTRQQQAEGIGKLPEKYRDIMWLMVHLGGRVSEALTLKISDANAERTSVTIQRTWAGGRIKDATKKYKPRTLPMSQAAAEVFRRAAGDRVGQVWLFPNPKTGKPYTLSFISHLWVAKSGFPDVPLKDATRRSRATSLRNAGVHLDAVRAYLGHTTTTTTQQYLQEDVEWIREELEKAEGRIVEMEAARAARGGGSGTAGDVTPIDPSGSGPISSRVRTEKTRKKG